MKNNKLKAFTLIEILIASTIFAGILILTAATLAQSGVYQSRLTAMREASEESRKMADLLTREIRSANSPFTMLLHGTNYSFKNGVAILDCRWPDTGGVYCNPVNNNVPSSTLNLDSPFVSINAEFIVISTKESYKIYAAETLELFHPSVITEIPFGVYYKEFPKSSYPTISETDIAGLIDPDGNNIISKKKLQSDGTYQGAYDTRINFGGFCPDDDYIKNNPTKNQQPYVQFYLVSRSKYYNDQARNSRYQSMIRTAVTLRSYNN